MINSGLVTVGTTATLLNSVDSGGGGDLEGMSILVRNPNATIVYIGGSTVTADSTAATGGYPLAQNEVMSVSCAAGEKLYARVATGTAVVNVLRTAA
jgi:hypothetical protein